jgi:hypothetical protein
MFGAKGFDRLDAEYVIPDDLCHEARLASRLGAERLAKSAGSYDGKVVNDSLYAADSTVRYIDIDSIDCADGLAHDEPIQFGRRPSRAKYVVQKNDILISNVRPNRGRRDDGYQQVGGGNRKFRVYSCAAEVGR